MANILLYCQDCEQGNVVLDWSTFSNHLNCQGIHENIGPSGHTLFYVQFMQGFL